MNIAVFGCGTYGLRTLDYVEKTGSKVGDKVVCFSDNNEKLWNTSIKEHPVCKPERMLSTDIDVIVITPVIYRTDIKMQLIQLGVPEEKCLFISDYESRVLIQSEYLRRYNGRISEENTLKSSKIVVYTGIFGAYDDLKAPGYAGEGVDYVCFTNQHDIKSDIWDVRYVDDSDTDNNMLGKIYKCFPDRFFPDYEVSVWVDGKVQIKNDFRTYIEQYGRDKPILCFPHYDRKCIYNEVFACMTMYPGIKMQLMKQITEYYTDSYPEDNGLYELSCIVRNHHDMQVKKLMQNWMYEIEKHSRRDQISFPYVCLKNDFLPDISNLDARNNYWMERVAHKHST